MLIIKLNNTRHKNYEHNKWYKAKITNIKKRYPDENGWLQSSLSFHNFRTHSTNPKKIQSQNISHHDSSHWVGFSLNKLFISFGVEIHVISMHDTFFFWNWFSWKSFNSTCHYLRKKYNLEIKIKIVEYLRQKCNWEIKIKIMKYLRKILIEK